MDKLVLFQADVVGPDGHVYRIVLREGPGLHALLLKASMNASRKSRVASGALTITSCHKGA